MAVATDQNKPSNKHYICLGQNPTAWNPASPSPAIVEAKPDCIYFGRVLEAMEDRLKVSGLTFYLTWNVNELPAYGEKVVAIVVGDEWCRIPLYSHQVRAIFKCYGTRRILGCNLLLKPSYLNFLTLIQFLRANVTCLQGWLNYQRHKLLDLQFNRSLKIYDIPLGYYKQLDLPLVEMTDRSYDVYFSGSIAQSQYSKRSLKYWIGEPKSVSRKQMIHSLEMLQKKYPELQIKLSLTNSFTASNSANAATYSEELMNSKICLVPRGTSFETFRFFEALRYGCIVVAEFLPPKWFYSGAPIIQVTKWSEIDQILSQLLSNKSLIQRKHQESLNWWETKCSEAAVGTYMANSLNPSAALEKQAQDF